MLQRLARHDKSLSMPVIVHTPLDEASGYYYEPHRGELEFDGKFYPGDKGIIVVSTNYPELIDSTITHEWRHHWQRFNKGECPYWPWQPLDDYEQSIRDYFKVWHEWDALMFEYRFARNELNDYWVGLLQSQ